MELAVADPKGLVRESYRIDGITLGECRSIFLDWALSLVTGQDVPTAINRLIAEYCAGNSWLKFIDVYAPMLDAQGRPRPELFGADKLQTLQPITWQAVGPTIYAPSLRAMVQQYCALAAQGVSPQAMPTTVPASALNAPP